MVWVKDRRKLDKVVRRVHEGLKKKYRRTGELHAYRADEITRKRLLRLLVDIDNLKIYYLALDKRKITSEWKEDNHNLYNMAVSLLFDQSNVDSFTISKNLMVFIDQRETSKYLQANLRDQIAKSFIGNYSITITPSHLDRGLQAADFVSWAIFRKYERGDCLYFDLIKNQIDRACFSP